MDLFMDNLPGSTDLWTYDNTGQALNRKGRTWRLVIRCRCLSKRKLETRWAEVEAILKALLERETLTWREIQDILAA